MDNALTGEMAPVAFPSTEEMAVNAKDRDHRSATLVIESMHCGGCMRKIEIALRAVPGVSHVRANLSSKRVLVDYLFQQTRVLVLVDALAGAGFRATELVDDRATKFGSTDHDYLKRMAVAGFGAANIMLLSVSVWSGANGDMPASLQSLFHWLSAVIALPTIAYAGQPFFRSAADALRARRVNMDVPISLGVTLATLMSVYQAVHGTEQVYFDAAVTLLFFLLVGRTLDARMRVSAAGAAANLLGLRAPVATVLGPDGGLKRMPSRSLAPGMRVLAAAGERIAVDGRIVAGTSELDESLITGETTPRPVAVGDIVCAGAVNLDLPVTIEATATNEDTLVAEVARLMTAAEQGRARYVRLADRAARIYAPAVHALGFATFLGWMAFGQGWEAALTAAIAVLIVTCPCALALAVPAVQIAAIGRLFSRGVIVKAPDALERLAEINAVVLDKTGTLTLGEPELLPDSAVTDHVLTRAASLAVASCHPYARAVVRAANVRGLEVVPVAGIAEKPGLGLVHSSSRGEERLGSAQWCGAKFDDTASLWFKDENGVSIPLRLVDTMRPDAAKVVAALQSVGLRTALLSGDRKEEVDRIADAAGIADRLPNMLPGDKLQHLAQANLQGQRALMIGDGLNDAPALAAAHVSLSPANAADISQTAADVIFQGAALTPVLEIIAVSREVRRMALQNFAIAIGYNVIFVPLAIAGLVTPLIAAIAMSASSIAVTANAVRLKRKKLRLGGWSAAS